MSDCDSLKFDKMVVDTSLAQEYFKKKNYKFMSIHDGQPHKKYSDYILDPCQNRVYCMPKNADISYVETNCLEPCNWTTPGEPLWKLAKKIEENGELFCQLQYALTDQPMEDIKNCDLPLLINRCLHISSMMDKYSEQTFNKPWLKDLIMDEAYLYHLAGAVSYLCSGIHVVITAPPRFAAVCTLFMDLCAEVGLHQYVSLELEHKLPQSDDARDGCMGIVSETADLDSAVQAFLSSTTLYPWKLKALLIQESVYEEFQRALQWKCNLNAEDDDQRDSHLKPLSADVQVAAGKIFLLDYVGGDVTHPTLHPVLVSAYRTTKELLTIMSKSKKQTFVSLWASDSAQAHEIAFSLSTPCVWINNYAVFNVSPQVSSALPLCPPENKNDKKLPKKATAWLNLDLEQRREIMFKTLHNYLESATGDDKKYAIRVQTLLKTHKPGFIEVNKSYLWLGIESAVGLVYVGNTGNDEYFTDAVASTVYGNSVLLGPKFSDHSVIEALQKAGVPIRVADKDTGDTIFKLFKTRVIYTNFGTIFAT